MIFLEYAASVKSRNGNMLPAEKVKELTGFRSAYGFHEQAAKEIKQQGHSRGLNKYPVYSDELLIDIDSLGDEVLQVKQWCVENEIAYKLYFSGGKGYHICIPTTPKLSEHLPFTHRRLCEKLGFPHDPSIYRHSSLFRLPGTVHATTGNQKVLEESSDGGLLDFTIIEKEPNKFNIQPIEDDELLRFGLSAVLEQIYTSPGNGRRHHFFWSTAKDLMNGGLSEECVAELLCAVNESWGFDAKEESEVLRAVSDAFRG